MEDTGPTWFENILPAELTSRLAQVLGATGYEEQLFPLAVTLQDIPAGDHRRDKLGAAMDRLSDRITDEDFSIRPFPFPPGAWC
jgi:hypothetical protein